MATTSRKNKKRISKHIKYKSNIFYSLAPVESDNYDKYSDAFKFALNHNGKNQKITNIAVTGPYASGKSSVIENVKEEFGSDKFITLSLTNFNSGDMEDDKIIIKSHVEEDLEAQLINQLIHKIDSKKIEDSRFLINKKIDTKDKNYINETNRYTNSILWALCLLIILFIDEDIVIRLLQIENTDFIKSIQITFSIIKILAFCTFVITSIINFRPILFKLISLFRQHRILRKVNIYGNELELFTNEEESIFDKYTDEILYLFKNAGVKYFIFEDIDRYEDVTIFKKLREINILLNETLKRENKEYKPIKFIYLICDNMFTAEEKTKFFDFIIPVVPYIHKGNAYDYMVELFADEINDERNKKFLIKVSLFIDNSRLIKNIANEYYIYSKFIKLKDRKPHTKFIKLLSLIIYKNLFPKDFNQLYFNKGYLAELFNKEEFMKNLQYGDLKQDLDNSNIINSTEYNDKEKYILIRYKKYLQYYNITKITDNLFDDNVFFKAPKGYDYIYSSGYFNLIKFLVKNGNIDDTYKDYMSEITENSLTYEERILLQNITAQSGIQYDLPLERIQEKEYLNNLLSFIDEEDFKRIEILNIDLLNQLIHNNYKEYYTTILNQLAGNNSSFEFIQMYYQHIGINDKKDNTPAKIDYEKINHEFTMFILNNYEKLFNLYKENLFFINIILNIIKANKEVFKKIVNSLINFKIIHIIKQDISNNKQYFRAITESYNNTFYYYENGSKQTYTTEAIMDDLAFINIIFDDITCIYHNANVPEDKVYNAAMKNLMFKVNFDNINCLLHFIDNTTEINNPIDIIDRIFNMENKKLQQYIFKNFTIFISTWCDKRNFYITRLLYNKIKSEQLIPYDAKELLKQLKINIID